MEYAELVINRCYGGFGLSPKALKRYRELSGKDVNDFSIHYVSRNDPHLVQVVKELGSDLASDSCSRLEVVEIPKGSLYRIKEYDGMERIEYANEIDWSIS